MKVATLVIACVSTLFAALAGCTEDASPAKPAAAVAGDGGATTPEAGAKQTVPSAPAPDAKGQFGGSDKSNGQTGQFVYQFEDPTNAAFLPLVDGVVKSAIVVSSINGFSNALTIPKDINVTARECGVVNAFYDPESHSVSLCYELMALIHSEFSSKIADKTPAEQMDITARAWAFIALHELGHAVIGENKLAVLGGEEDVVDDISGLIFVAAKAPDVPIYGTGALKTLSPATSSFSDEHSFSEQRYFNMLCIIYGSNPTEYADLVGAEADNLLPQERAARCPKEYADKQKAAEQLLGPFVRK